MHEERETQGRILDAAHAVFVRRGTAGARMQEIAAEAGVNKALLHYYFRSKDRLALAVFRRAAAQVVPRVFGILGSEAPLEEKVRGFVEAELEFLARHPYLPGFVVSEAHYRPEFVEQVFREVGPPPLGRLREQIEARVGAGEMRPIGAEEFLVNLLSLVFFPYVARPMLAVMIGVEGAELTDFAAARGATLADFFLGGLRP